MTEQDALAGALVKEACTRSALVWLNYPGVGRPRAAWHVWHSDAVYVVHEGGEQPLPGLADADRVVVTVRSKDKGGRLVTFAARPRAVQTDTEEWQAAVAALHGARLNNLDGEAQPERWAKESRITRLEPTGELTEQPGAMPDTSHATQPPPTPATTAVRQPYVFRRRRAR